MITVGFSVKETIDPDVTKKFKLNEKYVVSSYIDVLEINPNIVKHELHVDLFAKPIKQKARKIMPHLKDIVKVEIEKLKIVEFILEVKYP